jgi:hypothetical protein
MRKLLLAGVALAGVSGYLTTAAHAQSPVFPETTTPGKLDGAAPNSVTISIGFQQLTAIMAESGTGATGANQRAFPQLFNWFHFFPTMDYVTPGGIHWGSTAEIRNNNSGQGGLDGGNGGNTFYIQSATSYISSDRFGKFQVGTPNGALDDLGVGTGDDFGNGLFYSWYGPPNAPAFALADSYDGDVPRQKLTFAGVELEGSISSGKFNEGSTNIMSPGGPAPAGSKNSSVYTAGLGYNMGPFGIGAVYYGMNYDDLENGGPVSHTDTVNGEGIAGSYVVGPGMTLQLDAYTYQTKLPGGNTHGNIIALASQFAF